jgi:hypothetical protein
MSCKCVGYFYSLPESISLNFVYPPTHLSIHVKGSKFGVYDLFNLNCPGIAAYAWFNCSYVVLIYC